MSATTYWPYWPYGSYHCPGCRCWASSTTSPYITITTYGPKTILFAEWDDAVRFAQNIRSRGKTRVSKTDGGWQVEWQEPYPYTVNYGGGAGGTYQ